MFRRLGVALLTTVVAVPVAVSTASAELPAEFAPGSCIEQSVQTTPFVDVGPGQFFTNSVGWAFRNGITQGTDDTHFSPDALVTRAQFATFLHRMLCEPAAGSSAPFADVPDGSFFAAAVDWLWDNGYTQGRSPDRYDPDGFLTRGELAAFLYRLVDEPVGAPANPFGDVARNAFFTAPIDWLFDREITSGTSPTEFSPNGLVTRAQAVTFLYRLNIGAAGLVDPTELTLGFSTVLTGLSSPTAAALHPSDGSVYIAEQLGVVKRVPGDGAGAPNWAAGATTVLDIDASVRSGGERGLLGVAVSPDGARLYVSFTDNLGDSVIWEYDLVAGVPSGPPRVVIQVNQPASNHNGGNIAFGPDGHLYATFGDGGGAGDPSEHGQNTSTILGSVIRIAPTGSGGYTIPSDNPFVGGGGAAEIFLHGVRNPWKFSFDSFTGDLWVADVGQNAREELNRLEAHLGGGNGANLGWNTYEGTIRFDTSDPEIADHVGPIYEYQTGGPEGRSVTGGYVYRGDDISGLDGTYLWADYLTPELRGWNQAFGGPISYGVDVPGGLVSSFFQDANGEVYAVSLSGSISQVVEPA
ncbi:MAG: PQQ-dependent sugar dehydrogenase [Actinomycetota bacterium]